MNNQSSHLQTIELKQSIKSQLSYALGIMTCGIADFLLYKNLSIAKEAGWFTIVLGMCLIILLASGTTGEVIPRSPKDNDQ